MDTGISFEIRWFDQDVIEYQVFCSNGRFAGHASIYTGHNDLFELAGAIAGFPSNESDCRDFELGTFEPRYADGGIRMHFHCLDSLGHAAVDVKLRGDACKSLGDVESVALQIPVEAAAIDSFVSQIRNMRQEIGATALLIMAK